MFRIITTFSIMFFIVGCVSKPSVYTPYVAPKVELSDEELTEKRYEKYVSDMKAVGKTQEEIDKNIPYGDSPFEQSFKSSIYDSQTAAGNLLSLIDRSITTCDARRDFLNRAQGLSELERKYRIDYSKCILAGSSVVHGYFLKEYKGNERNTDEKKLVNEAYISWQTYVDAALGRRSNYVLEDLAEKVKTNTSRAKLSVVTRK